MMCSQCEIRRSGSKLEGKLQGRCSASTGWSNAQADLGNYYYTVPSGNWENTGEHRRRTSSNMRRRTYPIGDQVKKCYNKVCHNNVLIHIRCILICVDQCSVASLITSTGMVVQQISSRSRTPLTRIGS